MTGAMANLEETVASLRNALGSNLYSCCVYGSAVRGNAIEGRSDLNLLIVLEHSDVEAHEAIAHVLAGNKHVDPFVLGKPGFERSVLAFAPKFSSIKRNFRVLHGADPFAGVEIPNGLERFLCEQALRNLRLRLVFAFINRQRDEAFGRFLPRSVTPVFLRLTEVVRLSGGAVDTDFSARIPAFEKQFSVEGAVLRDLLALRQNPPRFSDGDLVHWHKNLLPLLDRVISWIEVNWPALDDRHSS